MTPYVIAYDLLYKGSYYGMLGLVSEAGSVYKFTADVRVGARGGGLMKRQEEDFEVRWLSNSDG